MKYEKELEVFKRLYEAGAFKPDFYNKKIVDFLSFLVEVSLTLKHLYSILYSGDFSSP